MTKNENVRHGPFLEEIIQNICYKMFTGNLVCRNPKFFKGKEEKESSDVLVIFNNIMLNFQLKSKIESKPISQKNDTDTNRVHSKILEGIGQLKTLTRALKSKNLNSVKTIHGFDLPIKDNIEYKKIGIIILNLYGEEKFPEHEQMKYDVNFEEETRDGTLLD
jgi:hypothetical protein